MVTLIKHSLSEDPQTHRFESVMNPSVNKLTEGFVLRMNANCMLLSFLTAEKNMQFGKCLCRHTDKLNKS